MHQSVALINLGRDGGTRQIYLDLASGVSVDADHTGMHWLPDVDQRWAHLEQFGFDCTQVSH
jgi:hypothetical protein